MSLPNLTPTPAPPALPGGVPIRRRQILLLVSAVSLLIGVVVFGLWLTDPKRKAHNINQAAAKKDVLLNYRTPGANLKSDEVWIERSETRLREMEVRNKDLDRQIRAIQEQMSRAGGKPIPPLPGAETDPLPLPVPELPKASDEPPNPVSVSPAFPAPARQAAPEGYVPGEVAKRRAPLPAPSGQRGYPSEPLPPPPAALRGREASFSTGSAAILSVRIGAPAQTVAPASGSNSSEAKPDSASSKTATLSIRNTLPTGSFGRAMLLSGVDAPTGGLARTNPHPVLMRVMDNAQLPNRFRSRVKECFITAAAYGDLPSERAYLRLEKLSCVLLGGEIVDTSVKGYVTGEDGKNGFRGRVVSKQGAQIGRAVLAGLASGLGKSVAQSYGRLSTSPLGGVTSVDPSDIAKVGAANGISNALEKIADFYIERANELYPIIEIDSAREGEAIFTDTVNLGAAFERVQNARLDDGALP